MIGEAESRVALDQVRLALWLALGCDCFSLDYFRSAIILDRHIAQGTTRQRHSHRGWIRLGRPPSREYKPTCRHNAALRRNTKHAVHADASERYDSYHCQRLAHGSRQIAVGAPLTTVAFVNLSLLLFLFFCNAETSVFNRGDPVLMFLLSVIMSRGGRSGRFRGGPRSTVDEQIL